jgi:hypothetical protein
MIVHRLVPVAGNPTQYYLEASPRIPVDSEEYPHMAVIAAIVYDARVRGHLAPLPATNVPRFDPGRGGYSLYADRTTTRAMRRSQGLTLTSNSETPRQYALRSGLGQRSRSVRSPSQFILRVNLFADIEFILGSAPF